MQREGEEEKAKLSVFPSEMTGEEAALSIDEQLARDYPWVAKLLKTRK